MTENRLVSKPQLDLPASENTRQAADLAALKRMLQVSQGCFSLSFAVCNDRTLRNDLIGLIKKDFPGLAVIELPPNTSDVYQTIVAQLSGSQAEALFVLELEASVPSQAQAFPALRTLNSSREAWEGLDCPVVFWLAEYAAALLTIQAPDFWRYRSHQFEFVAERPDAISSVIEPFPGFAMVDGLPLEEKRFRMAELEQRLREAGDPPEVELLPHLLDWLYELAHLYRHANRFDGAEELLRRAIKESEVVYGSGHPRYSASLNNLAQLLKYTNRLVEAENLMRRALEIAEKHFGTDPANLAICLTNLAYLLKETGRSVEGEPLLRRAIDISETVFGPSHPSLANCLNGLAQLLLETNRLPEAEALTRRALSINENIFGSEHPVVSRDLNNLAQLLEATNRFAEAEFLVRRSLVIDEIHFGTEHPNVATRLNNLAMLLLESNRLAEAEPLLRRALAINESSFGTDHPNVAILLNNLAQLFQRSNRLLEAEAFQHRALVIDENSLGSDNPRVAGDLNNLAVLLEITNRLDEAEPLLRRALAVDEKSFGPNHPDVARDLNNLASLLQVTNRFTEAEPLLRRVVSILHRFGKATGYQHLHIQTAVNNYTKLLEMMGYSTADVQHRIQVLLGGAGNQLGAKIIAPKAARRKSRRSGQSRRKR